MSAINSVAHVTSAATGGSDAGQWLANLLPANSGIVIVITAMIALLRLMWNSRVPMKKLKVEADQNLIEKLLARVTKLEEDNGKIHKDYEEKLTSVIAANETKIAAAVSASDAREALSEAREAVMRHELTNTRACFNALMLLLKRMRNPPEELAGIIADIETMQNDYRAGEDLQRRTLDNFRSSGHGVGGSL
jgi:chromosome segregation ATPase